MSCGRRLALLTGVAAALSSTAAHSARLSADAPIVLGSAQTVTLTLRLDADSTEGRPDLRVNVGAVEEINAAGPGLYRVTYRLPAEQFPQTAQFALVRSAAGASRVDVLGLPLYGALSVPVRTSRGNRVVVAVGEQLFGPHTVGETGTLRVPIIVPPGLRKVEVRVTGRRAEAARPVVLNIPPVQHLIAIALTNRLPANGLSTTTVHVFHDAGDALSPHALEVHASSGTVSFERADGAQLIYRYASPLSFDSSVAVFTVRARNDPASSATVPIELQAEPRPKPADPPAPTPVSREWVTLGARLGLVHNLVASTSPRFGAELWVQLPLPMAGFGVGLSGAYGLTAVNLPAPAATRATAHFVALAFELAYAHRLGPRLDVRAAVGPSLTLATSIVEGAGRSGVGSGFGGVAHLGAGLRLGPGRLFLDLSFRLGRVSTPDMVLDSGGLGLELGYQVRVL